MTVGHSLVKAMDTIIEKGKPIAATMLETGEGDIGYKHGNFEVVGTDRRVSLFQVAAHAAEMKKRGEIAEDLDTKTTTDTPLSFPNGVHTAEVEIDPDTGPMSIAHLYSGRRLRPRARSHDRRRPVARLGGGRPRPGADGEHRLRRRQRPARHRLVHGLRHAARRRHAADARRALDVPATTNPLGVKGVGEAGTTAAISAVMNAVADAIPNGAGDHLEMPATAQRLWEACQGAKN